MGISILELVLQKLRKAGFAADLAFPGQQFPAIRNTVAAVHLEQVDRTALTVTVGVNIVSPAAVGGAACELEALKATEVLRWANAECVQEGCRYDGVGQVYIVTVLATFTGVTQADSSFIGPGFEAFLDDAVQPYASAFTAEERKNIKVEYVMGEKEPVGLNQLESLWEICLEERIPAGSRETEEAAAPFQVRIRTDTGTEIYTRCQWTSIRREYTRGCLKRVRRGIATHRREEAVNG